MPRLNGTGPTGQGPMTGRGLGSCGGGMRRGFGCWGGYGYSSRGFVSQKNQLAVLEEEEKMLEEELAVIKEEIATIKDQK